MLKPWIALSLCCVANGVYAETNGWIDRKHNQTSQKIDRLAQKMDDWFGKPNPDDPASATLRVMLDTTWNKHDSLKMEPRVRGRIKLPTLEQKVSVVFGDDSVDNEMLGGQHNELNPANPKINNQTFHSKTTREDNSSIAVRWSNLDKHFGIDTDADIGIRSGDDVYAQLEARKTFQHTPNTSTQIKQTYRYGIDSKHFARSSVEVKHQQQNDTFVANYAHADYVDNKDDKGWSWGNSLYRQHEFDGHKRLNYGIQAGGAIGGRKHQFNSYGAFASWRQPVWRDWLFVQAELNFANNKDEGRKHYVGTFVRLEANF